LQPEDNLFTPRDKQVLQDLKQIFDELNLPILLVGAGARLIIFDYPNQLQGRTTKDWDIAIPLMNWSEYEQLRDRLTRKFDWTSVYHRFIHIETQITVDLIPFGAISNTEGKIQWQNDDTEMNVAGYNEAFENAITQSIYNFDLRVVNLPTWVGLKLLAWGDRGENTRKDLEDIDWILTHYQDDERVYDELYQQLADETLQYQDAAIYLLGQDIIRTFEPSTLTQIQALLTQLTQRFEDNQEGSFGYKLAILQQGLERL